ncbi:MAG: hypothetical protein JWM16_1684 [Verrucomicrobiales bacterium]|nr:hypothetical protein [Verrucomicrobiales bacterium]
MKFLVQKKKTGMFLRPNGTWTGSPEKGRDFFSSIAAVNHCLEEKMQDVCIVLAFEDERLNLRLDPFAVAQITRGRAERPEL